MPCESGESGKQSIGNVSGNVFAVRDDIHSFGTKFIGDAFDSGTADADAGTDRIDPGIAGNDGDLAAFSGFTGDSFDGNHAVMDLADLSFKKPGDEFRGMQSTS